MRHLTKILLTAGLAVAFVPLIQAQQPGPDAKDEAGWKDLFDKKSLDGWKVSDFSGPGKVQVKDEAIVMEQGKQMTGITYGRNDFPKMDYEVTLEGKKIAGDDFFCTTTFPVYGGITLNYVQPRLCVRVGEGTRTPDNQIHRRLFVAALWP